jgi:hypothetical protein
MLCEERLQLADFFLEALALCKGAFQSGSKIALILHEDGSGVFWIDDREPLQRGNLTEYRMSGDKMIQQLLIPQFRATAS